jgi:hypothetical protein
VALAVFGQVLVNHLAVLELVELAQILRAAQILVKVLVLAVMA